MKASRVIQGTLAGLVLAGLAVTAFAQSPRMKMTTPVPPGICSPNSVETRLGTLKFTDGCPDNETVEKVLENLDFQRGVQSVLTCIPAASLHAMREGIRTFGPDNTSAIIFEHLMDLKALFLTANTDSVYCMMWLDVKDGPVVIETPPNVLGIIDDFWFRYVVDFGNAGPDKGKGGKFLIFPPGYDGPVLDGYHVARTKTYGNWVVWRGFQVNGDPRPAVEETKRRFRVYPGASSDVGDVSYCTPTMGAIVTSWPLHVPSHQWGCTACNGMSIGRKGVMKAAHILAATGLDLLTDAELRTAAQAEFDKRTDGKPYKSLCELDAPIGGHRPDFHDGHDQLLVATAEAVTAQQQ